MAKAKDTALLDDARASALNGFLAKMSKDKPGEVLALDDESVADVDVISTGAVSLDVALGVGGIPKGRITELYGPTGGGKCLTADTFVWTDHGLETIAELFARAGQKASATSRVTDVTALGMRAVNENGELEQIAALTHNYLRPVRKVVLASGRHVEATHNHPLRVVDEQGWIVWRKVGDLRVGDRLVSAPFGADDHAGNELSIDEAVMLGYLVGEGSLKTRNAICFTNWDSATVADYETALRASLGDDLVMKHYGADEGTPAGKEHKVNSTALRTVLFERYGLDYVNAPAKTVPHVVRTGGRKVMQHFLSALMESDGWIAGGRVGLASASEQLVREVQLMFLGLGMQGTMRAKFNATYERDYYYLSLSREGSQRFLADIGFRTDRRDVVKHAPIDDAADMTYNVPGMTDIIRSFRDAVDSDRDLDKLCQHLVARSAQAAVSPRQLGRIAAWAQGKYIPQHAQALLGHITTMAEGRYVFDEVVELEDQGMKPTFDLMVPETHSFIANGVCSHNTTIALQAAAQCQKDGGNVGFIDAEHALSKELAINVGVDPSRFVVFQPDDGEQGIEMCEQMINSKAFDMIIVDSIAAMTPRAEIEAEVDQQHMALHARLMSKFMRRVAGITHENNVCLVLVNQVRVSLGSYGAPDTTTGGKAIPFFSSVRIEVRTSPSKKIVKGSDWIGQIITATVKKNKLASPFKVAEYDLIFGKGVSAAGSLLDVCEKLGLIMRAGSSYTDVLTGVRIGIGKDNVKSIIAADDEMVERLTSAVYSTLQAGGQDAVADAAEVDTGDTFSDEFDDELAADGTTAAA